VVDEEGTEQEPERPAQRRPPAELRLEQQVEANHGGRREDERRDAKRGKREAE
jgi:hypothetical protein